MVGVWGEGGEWGWEWEEEEHREGYDIREEVRTSPIHVLVSSPPSHPFLRAIQTADNKSIDFVLAELRKYLAANVTVGHDGRGGVRGVGDGMGEG